MNDWRIDSVHFPECGEYVKGKGFYNSNTGKYVSRKYEWMGSSVPLKYVRYEFKYYDDVEILERYGVKFVDRIGRFLSLIYRKSLNNIEGSRDVYVSHIDIAGLLGEGYYKDILSSLMRNEVIEQTSSYRMKYNANKFVKIFRLRNDFYVSEKRIRYVRNRQLYKFLESKNDLEYNSKDVFQKYELDVLKDIDVVDFDFDDIIDLRVDRKINDDLNDFLNIDLLIKKKEKKYLLSRLNKNRNGWKEEYLKSYKDRLRDLCSYFLDSIQSVKSGDITDYIYADSFSGRIYNPINNRFKEIRKVLRIDGEELVEVDLKNSYISLLYLVFMVLNDKVDLGRGGEEIKQRLGSVSKGRHFLREYRECFVERKYDFYKMVGAKLFNVGVGVDDRMRGYLKSSVLSLLNTRKSFEDGKVFYGKSYEQFMRIVFCNDGYEFLEYVKNNDVFEMYYEKNIFKGFLSYKNVPKLLMRMEVIVMKIVFDRLIKEKVKYVSLFDGFLCKKSEIDRVINIVNDEIEGFKCLEFKVK